MDELGSMKVADLKRELKSRGLSSNGTKVELITRLHESMLTSEKQSLDEDEDALLDEDSMLDDDEDEGVEEMVTRESDNLNATVLLVSPNSKNLKKQNAGDVETPETVPKLSTKPGPPKSANSVSVDSSPLSKKRKMVLNRDSNLHKEITTSVKDDFSTTIKAESDQNHENEGQTARVVKIGEVSNVDRAKLRLLKFGNGKRGASVTKNGVAYVPLDTPELETSHDKPLTENKIAKRAEKFGTKGSVQVTSKMIRLVTPEDEKINKRKERFGTTKTLHTAVQPVAVVADKESALKPSNGTTAAELKNKAAARSARFGGDSGSVPKTAAPASTTQQLSKKDIEERKKLRAERFGSRIKST